MMVVVVHFSGDIVHRRVTV